MYKRQECGVTAERFINLGVLYPTVGYDSEKIYIWAAKGLKPVSYTHLDVYKRQTTCCS